MANNILLIDDEKLLNDLYCQALRLEGYTVVQAYTAQEALQQQEKAGCSLIFLDFNLPDMNGVELCHQLRQLDPDCHIHAISGDIPGMEDELAGPSPFTSHLSKPLDIDLLLQTVQRSLNELQNR